MTKLLYASYISCLLIPYSHSFSRAIVGFASKAFVF